MLGCGAALATTPAATGLGQSWPNAPDLSVSPRFHAYSFFKSGVHYVQVNDINGTVRGAIGYVDGQVLELPIGVDAVRWTIANDGPRPAGREAVYQDDAMSIHAAPQPDGTLRLMVVSNCKEHPEECSVRGP